MKAAYFGAPGDPDVLRTGDRPTPEPQAGEVRVKVVAASVNPIDTYLRSGLVPTPVLPFITGRDFAGTVDAVGAGVTRFKVGDRVWGANQGAGGRPGSFAEFTVAGEEWVYPTTPNVSDDDAAAVALVGITAHLGLFHRAALKPGETVFVNGGTGGVGAMVVQMAKAVGAKVVTTVGTAEKAAAAKALGADVVLNYKTDDVAAGVKALAGEAGVDVWFETQPPGDLDQTVKLTAPRGRIVVMAGRQARPCFPNGPFYVKNLSLLGLSMPGFAAADQQACADHINHWLAVGKLRVTIGTTFALADAATAHRLQEENTLRKAGTLTGKIVVRPAG